MRALAESKQMMTKEDGASRVLKKPSRLASESSKIEEIILQGVNRNIVGRLPVKQVGSKLIVDVVELLYLIKDVEMEVKS